MFGYEPIKGSVLTWGARAIYKNGELDILLDRQQFSDYRDKRLVKAMAQRIFDFLLERLKEEFLHYMPPSSGEFVRLVFDFPDGPGNDKLVLCGSPNASFGYFYISVGLVTMADIPEEVYPTGYKTPEELKKLAEQGEVERKRWEEIQEAERQQRRQERLTRRNNEAAIASRVAEATTRLHGDELHPGDHFHLWANQAYRDAFCLKVVGGQALAEYFMPNGKRQLVVISKIVDESEDVSRKTYPESKLPKKWRDEEAA